MGWGRIDDEFDEHEKVLEILDQASPADAAFALALWVLTFTWAHRNTRKRGKTAGLLPSGLPRRYFGPDARRGVDVLVKHRLWDVTDGGWLIHDFDDYLPTEKTREERAAAGRKGAAARWHGHGNNMAASSQADGTLPESDGNLPSVDGRLPQSDGKPVANDGSRTPARRDPIPVPVPITQKAKDQDQTPLPPTTSTADGVIPGTEIVTVDNPAPKARRGSRLVEGWMPSESSREWARGKHPGVDLRLEHEKFTNYWIAKAGRDATKLDWDRTWQNWITTAAERLGSRAAPSAALPDGRSLNRKTAQHVNHLAAYGDDPDA